MGFRTVRGRKGESTTGNDGGDPKLKIPTDGSWEDGFFDQWKPETYMNDAIDDISELLKLLAPEKAGGIQITGIGIFYNAKLSEGNDAKWYINGDEPGDLIENYIINENLELETINKDESFKSGRFNESTTYGALRLVENNIVKSVYDMTNGLGGNDTVFITSLEQYNKLWMKSNAEAIVTLIEEGYIAFKMIHTEAGESNIFAVFFDTDPGNLSFKATPIIAIENLVVKRLSGVNYIGLGSEFALTFGANIGIYQHAYHATNVAKVEYQAMDTEIVNPVTPPNFEDTLDVNNLIVKFDKPNIADNNPKMKFRLYRPETNIMQEVPLPLKVCTYGIVSTCANELFFDEDRRLVLGGNTPWNSNAPLLNGNTQVRNGSLEYGIIDFSTKTGDQEYQRKFCKTAASTGFIKMENLYGSYVKPYGTGDINVLLYLDNDHLWYDLGRVVGDKNGTGSGIDRSNSIGGQVRFNGDTIEWSIGTNSTAYNNQEYRIVIIFKNNNRKITKIITT